jgi:hypothetical protein
VEISGEPCTTALHTVFDVARLQQGPDFKRPTQFGPEIASCPFQHGRVGKTGTKMWKRKTVPVAFGQSPVESHTASVAITVARLFGLDAGDWSMIFLGLALSGLLLAFA